MTIGHELERARQLKHWSKAKLAEALHTTEERIQLLETAYNRDNKYSFNEIRAVCHILEIDWKELIEKAHPAIEDEKWHPESRNLQAIFEHSLSCCNAGDERVSYLTGWLAKFEKDFSDDAESWRENEQKVAQLKTRILELEMNQRDPGRIDISIEELNEFREYKANLACRAFHWLGEKLRRKQE